jgi:post-segregation antitoxin (ccd killing protein)
MALVTASINIPVEMWEKSRAYHINRSAVAREAIGKEIARIEQESKCQGTRPSNHPDSTPQREAQ